MEIYDNDGNKVTGAAPKPFPPLPPTPPTAPLPPTAPAGELSIIYLLSQIEKIHSDNSRIIEAVNEISKLGSDHADGLKATAVAEIVSSRENTNQKMLGIYSKMYEDLRPADVRAEPEKITSADKVEIFRHLTNMVDNSDEFAEHFASNINSIMETVFK